MDKLDKRLLLSSALLFCASIGLFVASYQNFKEARNLSHLYQIGFTGEYRGYMANENIENPDEDQFIEKWSLLTQHANPKYPQLRVDMNDTNDDGQYEKYSLQIHDAAKGAVGVSIDMSYRPTLDFVWFNMANRESALFKDKNRDGIFDLMMNDGQFMIYFERDWVIVENPSSARKEEFMIEVDGKNIEVEFRGGAWKRK